MKYNLHIGWIIVAVLVVYIIGVNYPTTVVKFVKS